MITFLILLGLGAHAEYQESLRTRVASYFPKTDKIFLENYSLKLPSDAPFTVDKISPEPPQGFVYFQIKQGGETHLGKVFVRRVTKVAVAKTEIKRGETFSVENLELKETDVSAYLQTGFYEEVTALTDQVARQSIKKGEVIKPFEASRPYEVVQGQPVSLIAVRGALIVTVKAQSLENGRKGDWILVQNTATRKNIRAKVSAEGEVVIQ